MSALPGRTALPAAMAAVIMTAVGCDAGPPAQAPTHSPAPAGTASPSSPARAANRLALVAYTGMWREMQAAGVTADWKDPHLAGYASGEALRILVRGLRSAARHGLVIKGTLVIHPQVISAKPPGAPDQVVIRDCSDDSHWLTYAAATGKLHDHVPGGHRLVNALVTRNGSRWRVSRLAVYGEGTC